MTALQRKERPILFSGPMVRAILEGRKTVTRRVVKTDLACNLDEPRGQADVDAGYPFVDTENGYVSLVQLCPYGQPGDRLWVREAWAETYVTQAPGEKWVVYRECDNRTDYGGPWKPSIHMRRRDSRILLEITEVRVERLQAITEEQAKAEGLRWHSLYKQWGGVESHPASRPECPQWRWYESPITAFSRLWESINGSGSWDANPWVWVVEFKRIQP